MANPNEERCPEWLAESMADDAKEPTEGLPEDGFSEFKAWTIDERKRKLRNVKTWNQRLEAMITEMSEALLKATITAQRRNRVELNYNTELAEALKKYLTENDAVLIKEDKASLYAVVKRSDYARRARETLKKANFVRLDALTWTSRRWSRRRC